MISIQIKKQIEKGFEKCFDANQIESYFNKNGSEIFKARNHIKIFEINSKKYCIKSYGRPTTANKYIYSFFRKTKAERSFRNAKELLKLGINTPEPIAFINTYNKFRVLQHNYYMYEYEDQRETLAMVLKKDDLEFKTRVIKELATFINQLTEKKILNLDFNVGNILVKEVDDCIEFSLIDINRIRFNVKYSHSKYIKSVQALKLSIQEWELISNEFSKIKNLNATEIFYRIISFKFIYHKYRSYIKKQLHFLGDRFKFKKLSVN